jgi:hypothetical protein
LLFEGLEVGRHAVGGDVSLVEINRRPPLPEHPFCQSVELLGTGQATGRDIDGTVLKNAAVILPVPLTPAAKG